jgi:hypothetical protein
LSLYSIVCIRGFVNIKPGNSNSNFAAGSKTRIAVIKKQGDRRKSDPRVIREEYSAELKKEKKRKHTVGRKGLLAVKMRGGWRGRGQAKKIASLDAGGLVTAIIKKGSFS